MFEHQSLLILGAVKLFSHDSLCSVTCSSQENLISEKDCRQLCLSLSSIVSISSKTTLHSMLMLRHHFTNYNLNTVTALIAKHLLFPISSATQWNLYMLTTLSCTVNNQINSFEMVLWFKVKWFSLSHMFTWSDWIAGVDYLEKDVTLQQFPAAVLNVFNCPDKMASFI